MYYHYASDEMGSITHVVTGQEKGSVENGEVPGSTTPSVSSIICEQGTL